MESPEYLDTLREAVALAAKEERGAAIEACERALALRPGGAEALCVLGVLAAEMGDPGRSIALLEKANAADPDCRDYADALAVVYTRVGRLTDGLYYAKLALALQPNPAMSDLIPPTFRDYRSALADARPPAHFVNAMILVNQRRFAEAEEECLRFLGINNRDAEVCRALGRIRMAMRKFGDALVSLRTALEIEPGNPLGHVLAGECMVGLGHFEEARYHQAKAAALAADDVSIQSRLRYAAARLPDVDWTAYKAEGRRFAEACLSGVEAIDLAGQAVGRDDGKIRVGYLSDGFWASEIRPLLDAIFNGHDRRRVEICGYQTNVNSDTATTQFKARAFRWREIHDVDDDTAAYIIAGDELDILVDLCGYGENQRLALLARRPAPVIASWLSWPHGSELPTLDCVLSGPDTVDADQELADGPTCLAIDGALLVFDADSLASAPADAPAGPAAASGAVTFGGVCDLARLTPAVARTWSEVLRKTPGSRLLLGYVDTACPMVQARARDLFAECGVAERIAFQEPAESGGAAFLADVDVLLDTFPVNGVIETCEALLAGVPVVTVAGDGRLALMGASILRAAERGDWVAPTLDTFVDIAVGLAENLPGLLDTRKTLGKAVRASRLCDVKGFATALEGAYRRILRERAPSLG